MRDRTKRVLILRGIPGAGKTRMARTLYPHAIVCSADDHFTRPDGSYVYVREEQSLAHHECLLKYLRLLTHFPREIGVSPLIIVDNTNASVAEIAPYYATAEAYGWEAMVETILCDPEIAWRRNTHGVSREIVEKIHSNLLSAQLPSWWKHSEVNARTGEVKVGLSA